MQQERLAVIAGMIAGLRDHDEVRPQADDGLQRGKSAEAESEIAGRIEEPGFGEQRADKTVAARDPAAPRQRQHAIMPLRSSAPRARQRRVEPRDFRRRAIGMPGDVAGLADLEPRFGERSRHGEFGQMKPLGLQQFPRRTLVEQAGNDNVGFCEQYVLGPTGQDRIAPHVVRRQRLPTATRKPAQPDDLLGVGQRQQQLIGADVHRHHARQTRCVRRAGRHRQRDRNQSCEPSQHQRSAHGTITVSR